MSKDSSSYSASSSNTSTARLESESGKYLSDSESSIESSTETSRSASQSSKSRNDPHNKRRRVITNTTPELVFNNASSSFNADLVDTPTSQEIEYTPTPTSTTARQLKFDTSVVTPSPAPNGRNVCRKPIECSSLTESIQSDLIKLKTSSDIDQLTFILKNMADLPRLLRDDTLSQFTFTNGLSRTRTMKSSRVNFRLPNGLFLYKDSRRLSCARLHYFKNTWMFDVHAHNMRFAVYALLLNLPASGKLENNFMTKDSHGRIIDCMNNSIVQVLDDGETDQDEKGALSHLPKFYQKLTTKSKKEPGQIRIEPSHRETTLNASTLIGYCERLQDNLSQDDTLDSLYVVVTSCDLKNQTKAGQRKQTTMDRINMQMHTGYNQSTEYIRKSFSYFFEEENDIHGYFDFAFNTFCEPASNKGESYIMMTKMNQVKLDRPTYKSAEEKWREKQREYIYWFSKEFVKNFEDQQFNVAQDAIKTGVTQYFLENHHFCEESNRYWNSLREEDVLFFTSFIENIRIISTAWDDVPANQVLNDTDLVTNLMRRHGFDIDDELTDRGNLYLSLLAYVEELVSNQKMTFMRDIAESLGTPEYLKSVDEYWERILELEIYVEDEVNEPHTLISEYGDGETCEQYVSMKKKGSQYPLFFTTEYGNYHTGNPVVHLQENSDNYQTLGFNSANDKTMHTPFTICRESSASGFQLYTSPLKLASGQFDLSGWENLHLLPLYLHALLSEVALFPAHCKDFTQNMMEIKKLIDLIQGSFCKEIQLRQLYVRAEFMLILEKENVEKIPDIPFGKIVDVVKKQHLINFLDNKISTFVHPLNAVLETYQRAFLEHKNLQVTLSPEAKTACVLYACIIANEYSNIFGSKHAYKSIMNEIREAGHVHIPEQYLTDLSQGEKAVLKIGRGVKPTLLQFNHTRDENQLVVRHHINKYKYIDNFTTANKSHIISAFGRHIDRPISYTEYVTMATRALHKYSGRETHGYYNKIDYGKLRELGESERARLIKEMFYLVADCYRGDWREYLFARHNTMFRERKIVAPLDYTTKKLFPSTVNEYKRFINLRGNRHHMLSCPYTKESETSQVTQILTSQDLIKNCFLCTDPEMQDNGRRGWSRLTSRKLLLHILEHIRRIDIEIVKGRKIDTWLTECMIMHDRDEADTSPSIFWKTTPSKLFCNPNGLALAASNTLHLSENIFTTVKAESTHHVAQSSCRTSRSWKDTFSRSNCTFDYVKKTIGGHQINLALFLSEYHKEKCGQIPRYSEGMLETELRMKHIFPSPEKYTEYQNNIYKKLKRLKKSADGISNLKAAIENYNQGNRDTSEVTFIKILRKVVRTEASDHFAEITDAVFLGLTQTSGLFLTHLYRNHRIWLERAQKDNVPDKSWCVRESALETLRSVDENET